MATTNGAEKTVKTDREAIHALEEEYLFPTYKRYDLYISHGDGCYVYDLDGRRFADFLGGIAVNALGHNHPRIVRVLTEQGPKVIHCSNLYYHPYQGQLAQKLCRLSGMSKVFFTNSGAEAIEAALKIARAYGHMRGNEIKTKILTLRNSFHGRTFGALSVTAQEKYQAPFRPLVPGIQVVGEFTRGALENAFDDNVCALVMEPIQGEGGINPLAEEFLRCAREMCDKYDAALIFDEIQSGMGRTGRFFAHEHYDVRPDLITLAKSLAGGYPLGAVLGNARVSGSLKPGEHGTTFGGGPLACRLALEVIGVIEEEGLLQQVEMTGRYLLEGLKALAARHTCIREVRGLGLMIGVELGSLAKETVTRLMQRGILANAAHETVLRLLPPYTIPTAEIDRFLVILDEILSELTAE